MSGQHTAGEWTVSDVRATDDMYMVLGGDDAGFGLIADVTTEADANLIAAAPTMFATLTAIADESVFNQQRFAEDTDADYFLRCFKAVKDRARTAIQQAQGQTAKAVGGDT